MKTRKLFSKRDFAKEKDRYALELIGIAISGGILAFAVFYLGLK